MLNTILGTKSEMAQAFVDGKRLSVTKVKAEPCVVTAIKSQEKDGYWAVQLGLGQKRVKNITKPLQGHLSPSKAFPRYLREVRVEEEPEVKVGDKINSADIFAVGDRVAVTGTSKSKGFAGVVKRWHFAGGPKTHGQSDRHRAPGSIGQGTTPGRVFKGKKMAGRMGGERTTIKNLKVVAINSEKQELELSGPVPGSRGTLLVIKKLAGGQNAKA
jgi:large subunit ribosomal protein L3